MPIPPPPPGFTIDSAPPQGLNRPVIRRAPSAPTPNLPQGWQIDPTGSAKPVPGLPKEFTDPKSSGGKTSYSTLSAAEAKQLGLPPGVYQRSSEGKVDKVADSPKGDADPRGAVAELVNVMDKAFRAKELSREGWFTTGFGANKAKEWGGTQASDTKGLLDTIAANTAFTRLQKMRDESPTGGALGAISERELALLSSTIASLDQGQSDGRFQQSMQDVVNAYGRVLMKLPGGKQLMQQRGWLGKKAPPKAPSKGRVLDFNDLPE